jgi:hypothetical protein
MTDVLRLRLPLRRDIHWEFTLACVLAYLKICKLSLGLWACCMLFADRCFGSVVVISKTAFARRELNSLKNLAIAHCESKSRLNYLSTWKYGKNLIKDRTLMVAMTSFLELGDPLKLPYLDIISRTLRTETFRSWWNQFFVGGINDIFTCLPKGDDSVNGWKIRQNWEQFGTPKKPRSIWPWQCSLSRSTRELWSRNYQ